MIRCDRCHKYYDTFECYICTDFICDKCDLEAHIEFMDKICCNECSRPEVTCSSCTLALTPEGDLHPLTLLHLQGGVK